MKKFTIALLFLFLGTITGLSYTLIYSLSMPIINQINSYLHIPDFSRQNNTGSIEITSSNAEIVIQTENRGEIILPNVRVETINNSISNIFNTFNSAPEPEVITPEEAEPEFTLINTELLKSEIEAILGDEITRYGIYLYDANRKIELGINKDTIFPPMSISKLPVGIMVMRAVDMNEFLLSDTSVFDLKSTADPTNVLTPEYLGIEFTIADYLRFLLVDSDNASIRKLESLLGGYELLNEKVKNELGVTHFFRDPHDATAADVGRVWKGIYHQEYLSFESNSYLVGILQNTSYLLQDGFPVGVPDPYKSQIAHKTGQGSSLNGFIWEDSGIIFGPVTDYVLVVLNEDVGINTARSKIQQISKLVWNTLQV